MQYILYSTKKLILMKKYFIFRAVNKIYYWWIRFEHRVVLLLIFLHYTWDYQTVNDCFDTYILTVLTFLTINKGCFLWTNFDENFAQTL